MPDIKQGSDTPFLTDVKTLRERARQHIQAGAVTSNYGADPKVVCKVLNDALATEIVCVLRYKRHYFMAQGICVGFRQDGVRSSMRRRSRSTPTGSPSGSFSSAASPTSIRIR